MLLPLEREKLLVGLNRLGINLIPYRSYQDYKFDGSNFGNKMDAVVFDKILERVYGVCLDLKKRFFIDFKKENIFLFNRDAKKYNVFAHVWIERRAVCFSSVLVRFLDSPNDLVKEEFLCKDWNNGRRMVSHLAFTCQRSKKTAVDFVDSIIRHEIGHLLTKKEHIEKIRPFLRGYKSRTEFKHLISVYGSKNAYEAVAEVFALYTDKKYIRGTLCWELELLAENMLNGAE